MVAKAALARAALDNRIALLAWAPPLLGLGLCVTVACLRHAEQADIKAPAVASDASTLAGAGSAIVSHASFY